LGYNIFSLLNQRFFIELFYNKYISESILKSGNHTTKILDKGSVEMVGPYGLEKLFIFLSSNISKLDTGIITTYALYILCALIIYLFMIILSIDFFLVVFFFLIINAYLNTKILENLV